MTPDKTFITLFTGHQNRLYAFIFSLVADAAAAEDILQQTNLVIWDKASAFEPGTDFTAWAMSIARYEVMSWRKKRGRERLVFGDELMERLEQGAARMAEELEPRMALLTECMGQLTDRHTAMLRRRYHDNASMHAIAEAAGQPVSAVKQALYRARQALAKCMRRRMGEEGLT